MRQKLFSVWAVVMALVCVPVLSSCGGDDDDDSVVAGGGSSTGGDNGDNSGGKATSDRELIYPFLGWNSTMDEVITQYDPAKWDAVNVDGYRDAWVLGLTNKGDDRMMLGYYGHNSEIDAVQLYYFDVDYDFFKKVKAGVENKYDITLEKNDDLPEDELQYILYMGNTVINGRKAIVSISHNIDYSTGQNVRSYILVYFMCG